MREILFRAKAKDGKWKELSEFYRHDNSYDNAFGWAFEDREKKYPLTRPPQSWCYVED